MMFTTFSDQTSAWTEADSENCQPKDPPSEEPPNSMSPPIENLPTTSNIQRTINNWFTSSVASIAALSSLKSIIPENRSLVELPECSITRINDFNYYQISSKVINSAKSVKSLIHSAAITCSEVGEKLMKKIVENSIAGDLIKEQELFIKEQEIKNLAACVPPWLGVINEEGFKEDCLLLSLSKRNFLCNPPMDFQFDFDISFPIAIAIMKEDSNLVQMRFDLVPKLINEETFWRNYFYRVSLISNAYEISVAENLNGDPDTELIQENVIFNVDSIGKSNL